MNDQVGSDEAGDRESGGGLSYKPILIMVELSARCQETSLKQRAEGAPQVASTAMGPIPI